MKETKTEKNYISKDAFRRWVRAMHRQFVENAQAITTCINGTTYVYLRSKVGVARRNPNDTADPQVGIAYAWARCTGQPVYYEEEEELFTIEECVGKWVETSQCGTIVYVTPIKNTVAILTLTRYGDKIYLNKRFKCKIIQ